MKNTPQILSFNGGEVSPKIDLRFDIEKYYSACRTMENFVPLVEGGAVRSPGTYFVIETKDSTKETRVVPFHFSTTQSYCLEFGDYYIRFYKDNGQIVVAYAAWVTSTAYAIGNLVTNGGKYYRCLVAHTAGTFATDLAAGDWEETNGATDLAYEIPTPYPEADLFNLKFTQSADTMYIVHGSYAPRKLTRSSHTVWKLSTIDFDPQPLSENGHILDAGLTPGATTGTSVTFTADDSVFIGGDVGRQIVSGLSKASITAVSSATEVVCDIIEDFESTDPIASGDWSLSGSTNGSITPNRYKPKNAMVALTSTSMFYQLWVTSTSYYVGDIVKVGVTYYQCLVDHIAGVFLTDLGNNYWIAISITVDLFRVEDVGKFIIINNGIVKITTYVSATQVYGRIVEELSNKTETEDWTMESNAWDATNGYPEAIAFFESRLWFARNQTLWGSISSDFEAFSRGTDDDDSVEYTLTSGKVDKVLWMIGYEYLMIGTAGGIWKFGSTSLDDPVTPTNVSAKKQIDFGAKNIQPHIATDAILWVTRSGMSVKQLSYSFEIDKYISPDMARIAKHIMKGVTLAYSGIVDMAFQNEPIPILWMVRADGQLVGLTYETQEQIYAFFRVVTDGYFESICVISKEGSEDQLWAIVKRTINSSDVRYIEYVKPFDFYSELADSFFVHSGLSWTGVSDVAVSAISKAATCIVTLAASHGVTPGKKLRFSETGTWLDEHIVTAHAVNVNDITLYTESDASAIDSTDFDTYVSGGTVETVLKTVTGLSHLEGESVVAMVDGGANAAKTVSSGSITLDSYGNKIHVGLNYTSTLEPMKINVGGNQGTSRGKKQKISRLLVSFYETVGGKIGKDTDNLKSIPFGLSDSPELFTGDKIFEFYGDYGDDCTISIVQDQPLPMTVLGIIPTVTVNES